MTALVTGASSGIGRALLPLFAAAKQDLVLVARRVSLLEEQRDELERRYGVRVHVLGHDLSVPGAAAQVFEAVQSRGIEVDFLVNNAGFGSYGDFAQLPIPVVEKIIAVNVSALTELTRRFLDPMIARGRGKILQVASTAAFGPGPRLAVYHASKAYVLTLSEALSQELSGSGITVTTLCPGPTKSEWTTVARFDSPAFDRQSMSSEDVARIGYRAMMKGDRLAVCGAQNKGIAIMTQLLPRAFVLAMADRLLRSRGEDGARALPAAKP